MLPPTVTTSPVACLMAWTTRRSPRLASSPRRSFCRTAPPPFCATALVGRAPRAGRRPRRCRRSATSLGSKNSSATPHSGPYKRPRLLSRHPARSRLPRARPHPPTSPSARKRQPAPAASPRWRRHTRHKTRRARHWRRSSCAFWWGRVAQRPPPAHPPFTQPHPPPSYVSELQEFQTQTAALRCAECSNWDCGGSQHPGRRASSSSPFPSAFTLTASVSCGVFDVNNHGGCGRGVGAVLVARDPSNSPHPSPFTSQRPSFSPTWTWKRPTRC